MQTSSGTSHENDIRDNWTTGPGRCRARDGGGQPPAAAAGRGSAQPAAAQAKPALTPEEKAVVDGVNAFSSLYSAANAEALAGLFLDEASIIDPDGYETRGKAAVAEMYAAAFQESPGLKVQSKVDEVRFLTPDVARVHWRVGTFFRDRRCVGVYAV